MVTTAKTAAAPVTTNIVVLDRGFVYVGKVSDAGENLKIENARCIRRWGTTKGLLELQAGPTSKTQLDEEGTVIAPKKSVIHLIVCTKDW
jgi:hypothetical protein